MISVGEWLLLSVLVAALSYLYRRHRSRPDMPQATPKHPLWGNAPYFRRDPIKYLLDQRARHGDHFLVDLTVFRVAFFVSPEAVNAVMGAKEMSGTSLYKATNYFFSDSFMKGNIEFKSIF